MYFAPYSATAMPSPPAETVASLLSGAGLSITSTDILVSPSDLTVTMRDGSALAWSFAAKRAFDEAATGWGFGVSYPMAASASASVASVSSTVTITADTGDPAFAGPVDFYVGDTLQSSATAVGGKATCSVTSASSGTVTVYAWSPAYGYDSATVTFQ